ncbi:hypothetical protein TNCV_2437851 [Trichonephila clavipes]|nr:hypothetical protein TNCV_2437851 [Trichonephila clavipes]
MEKVAGSKKLFERELPVKQMERYENSSNINSLIKLKSKNRNWWIEWLKMCTTLLPPFSIDGCSGYYRLIGTKNVELSAIPINLLSILNFLKLNSKNLVGSISYGSRSVHAWGCKSATELESEATERSKHWNADNFPLWKTTATH